MNDFIHAAMPWIMMALAVAVLAASTYSAKKNRDKASELSEEEQVLLKKKQNERMATCIAIGLLAGIGLGCTPLMDIPAGAACGALIGIIAGWIITSRKKA